MDDLAASAAFGAPIRARLRHPRHRAGQALPMRHERPLLAPDLVGAVALAGVDPTLEGRALQDALRRGGSLVGAGGGRDGDTICDNGAPGFGRDAMGAHGIEPFTAPEAPGQPEPDPAPGCARTPGEIDAEPWLRTELFFGCARPDGTAVAAAEWDAFLDAEIAPRFPEGLTVLSGAGQWQEADGDVIEEWSKVVVLLYPRAKRAESHADIEAIRAAYRQRFGQEAVLRADDARPIRASF